MGYRLTIKSTLQGTYLDFKKRFLIYSVSNIALVDKKGQLKILLFVENLTKIFGTY